MAKQTFTTGQVLTAAQMTSLQQTAMGGGAAVTKTASYVLVAADAGTTIQINSASPTTITVNTALFAAGDVVFLQNIGAGACTVTAGTATVTTAGSLVLTQWEGGQLYFTSTSASIFFDYIQAGTSIPLTTKGDLFGYDTANARIPIGTNNQVLTADSTQALGLKWATPTGSLASYSLLNSGGTALSGTTTTVSGISGMSSLLVVIDGGSATTGSQAFRLRLNTDTTAANYGFWSYSINNPATYASSIMTAQNNGGDGYFPLVNMQSTAASLVYAAATISGANSTGIKTMDSIGGSTPAGGNTGYAFSQKGIYSGTSTISSISIFCGGTMDAGTVYVYGSAV